MTSWLIDSAVHACPAQRTRERYGPLLDLEPDDIEWLCSTCARQLGLGGVPSGASKANNLELAPIPAELLALNPMEVRLISPVRHGVAGGGGLDIAGKWPCACGWQPNQDVGIGMGHCMLWCWCSMHCMDVCSSVFDACTCAC